MPAVFDMLICARLDHIVFVIVDTYHYPVVLHFFRGETRKLGVGDYAQTFGSIAISVASTGTT